MAKKSLIIIFLLIGWVFSSHGQFSKPFVKNYSPKDYGAFFQNWDVAQDKHGVMYFANNLGILVFNGVDWQLINTPNGSIIRSVELVLDGKIFVGGYNQIGYIDKNELGAYEFVSIMDSSEVEPEFGSVWNIEQVNDVLYFSTDTEILKYKDGKVTSVVKKGGKLFKKVNGRIYTMSKDHGLSIFKDDKILPIIGGDFFKTVKVYSVASNRDGLLLATREDGLFYFTEDTLYNVGNEKTKEIILSSSLYSAEELPDGNICLATLKNGAIIINQIGEIVEIFNSESGLQNQTCWGVFHDKQGNLWMALDKGISKIEYNCPFSIYNQNVGLEGTIMDIIRYNNNLYIATSVGLYNVESIETELGDKMVFNIVKDIKSQCWDLEVVNGHLIVASSAGTFSINSKGNVVKHNDLVAYSLLKSKYYSNLLFLGSQVSLSYVVFDGPWREYKIDSLDYEIRSICETSENELWLGTYLDGSIQVKYELGNKFIPSWVEGTKYSYKQGLFGSEIDVFEYKEDVIFSTDIGLMRRYYDGAKLKFEADTTLGTMFSDSSRIIYRLKEDYLSNTWMYAPVGSDNFNENGSLGFVRKHNNSPIWNSEQFNRLPQGITYAFYPEMNGEIWIGGVEGLVRYNYLKNTVKYNSIFYSLINKVSLGADSVIHNGYGITSNKGLKFEYAHNSILFEYSCTSFLDESRNSFQFKLDGFDEDWSEWTSDVKKQYTNLSEGVYEFKIRSKNIYNDMGIESNYKFEILPPWYRTWLAYTLYILLFGVLILIIVRISVYRLKLKNERLEQIIENRTKEIRDKNIQLREALNDIHDSISYAKRLQDAFLPEKKEIDKFFPSNFILYLPRDIVSGDFYWMSKLGDKRIFAVADCTGHGVPGAFVSMLGNELLNNIVNERRVDDTSKILSQLNQGVQNVFKSEDSEITTNDGMDICLVSINDKNELEYSGAHRPLIVVRDGEIIELGPDKRSIGGRTEVVYEFAKKTIQLEKDDVVYMYSDGYADQFGGPKGKKFLTKKLKKMLAEIALNSIDTQKEVVQDSFMNWKGKLGQLDDVLLVGIKI